MVNANPILGTMSGSGGLETFLPDSNTSLSALISIGQIADLCFNLGTCPQIALLQGINSSANGTNLTIDSSNPNFAAVVSKLTNGVLDYVFTGVIQGPSYGASAGAALGLPETTFGTSPDFAGQTISSLVLHIDDVIIQPVPFGGTEFHLDYTLTVFGVPEPATACTFAIGLGALIALQRKLRHRSR
jgi:hypothetical protein